MNTIDEVAIIGGGTMGRRIAYGCVIKGVSVRLFDTLPAALEAAVPSLGDSSTSGSPPAGYRRT